MRPPILFLTIALAWGTTPKTPPAWGSPCTALPSAISLISCPRPLAMVNPDAIDPEDHALPGVPSFRPEQGFDPTAILDPEPPPQFPQSPQWGEVVPND